MNSKYVDVFIVCCWIFIICICGILLFIAFRPAFVHDEVIVCGNAVIETSAFRGREIFQDNCASCHNTHKESTGPALADISSFRSQEWLCRFLTDSNFVAGDKRAVNLRKQYGTSCIKFPKLTCNEVSTLIKFFEARW